MTDLDLMVDTTGLGELERKRRDLDERLRSLDEQQGCIEQWLEQLERRKQALQREWNRCMNDRDDVEQAIWERQWTRQERSAAPPVRGTYRGPQDLVAEPWDLDAAGRQLCAARPFGTMEPPPPNVAREGVEPVRSPPRPAPRVGAPSWAPSAATAPIVLPTLPLRR